MKYFTLLLLFFSISAAFSQTRVEGRVVDKTGDGLPFVSVVFENASEGVNADENGYFLLKSLKEHAAIKVSYLGYKTEIISLEAEEVSGLKIILEEKPEALDAVRIVQGKTSKKDNPAIDILKKIRENRRENGINAFDQYEYKKYEKLEFELSGLDSNDVKNPLMRGMDFIFDYADTNRVSGKSYLPIFINESVSKIYGDNTRNLKREDLLGNKNSGFSENQNLIDVVKQSYDSYDIYADYFKVYDKSFVSPLGRTGIHNYNYVLTDTVSNKGQNSYRVMFYPRRKGEFTFSGEFWVKEDSWAITKISLETAKGININWVRNFSIEQEFEIYKDSVFLLKKDFFTADFSYSRNSEAKGINAYRNTLYEDYQFNRKREKQFYSREVSELQDSVFNRDEAFWKENRIENLKHEEKDIYVMMDSLSRVKSFKRLYDIATIAKSGYVEFKGWDFGTVYNLFGYNEVEGLRTRIGGRTYFGQHDPWRVEGYLAYGISDKEIKYGIQGKWMLDKKSRLILSGGYRKDIEQLGAGLTTATDVLGRSLASSSLLNVGNNNKLSRIKLALLSLEFEPFQNFRIGLSGSKRNLESASDNFSLAYYTNDERTETSSVINQTEITTRFTYTPGRKFSGYGVERRTLNEEEFPTFFLNYSLGLKEVLHSDFNYKKLQLFYNHPMQIGGFGRANASLEAGKTFGEVPLGLLSVVPGNQTYFAMYNSFPTLDFYEFVTDTYISAHFSHNFNGRLFSRIPGIRNLNLREIVGIRGVWGEISENNRQLDASGLDLRAPDEAPFWELSAGIGNILKFLTVEGHFRGNYFENPDARDFALTFSFGFDF